MLVLYWLMNDQKFYFSFGQFRQISGAHTLSVIVSLCQYCIFIHLFCLFVPILKLFVAIICLSVVVFCLILLSLHLCLTRSSVLVLVYQETKQTVCVCTF